MGLSFGFFGFFPDLAWFGVLFGGGGGGVWFFSTFFLGGLWLVEFFLWLALAGALCGFVYICMGVVVLGFVLFVTEHTCKIGERQ